VIIRQNHNILVNGGVHKPPPDLLDNCFKSITSTLSGHILRKTEQICIIQLFETNQVELKRTAIMAGKKAATENTKKASGNAKKAEAAQKKAAVENEKKAAVEDEDWGKGAKSNAKKYGVLLFSARRIYTV